MLRLTTQASRLCARHSESKQICPISRNAHAKKLHVHVNSPEPDTLLGRVAVWHENRLIELSAGVASKHTFGIVQTQVGLASKNSPLHPSTKLADKTLGRAVSSASGRLYRTRSHLVAAAAAMPELLAPSGGLQVERIDCLSVSPFSRAPVIYTKHKNQVSSI